VSDRIENGYRIREHANGMLERVLIGADPPGQSVLSITIDAAVVAAGTPVAWSAAVRDADDALVPISGTYYVPVLRQDGWQARLLTVALTDGQCAGSFAISEAGIYTINLSLMRPLPLPQSRLDTHPELIVTET